MRRGTALQGMAWHGVARLGMAWRGKARQGKGTEFHFYKMRRDAARRKMMNKSRTHVMDEGGLAYHKKPHRFVVEE